MKKVLAIAAVAAMVPCTVFAKSAITDSEMGKVTGQSGVSIDMDVRFDVKADTMAWGNSDGAGTTSWIGMKNFNANNFSVRLRPELLTALVEAEGVLALDPTNTTKQQAVADAAAAIKPLTIDVKTAAADSGNKKAGTSYVSLGLGSLQLGVQSMDFDVALGHTNGAAPTTANLNQELGSVHMGNLVASLNGQSTVDIYSINPTADPTKGSGVVFDLNVIVDKMKADSISWGNKAGTLVSTSTNTSPLAPMPSTTAGYVGFANMNIDTMKVTGPLSIQVATVDTSDAALGAALTTIGTVKAKIAGGTATAADMASLSTAAGAVYYANYDRVNTGMGKSVVHFGLGSGNSLDAKAKGAGALAFEMASMTADVKVGNNNGLYSNSGKDGDTNTAGTYGSMAISNLSVAMNGWVNIGTH